MDTRLQEGIIGFLLFVVGKENQTANFMWKWGNSLMCKTVVRSALPFFFSSSSFFFFFLAWHTCHCNLDHLPELYRSIYFETSSCKLPELCLSVGSGNNEWQKKKKKPTKQTNKQNKKLEHLKGGEKGVGREEVLKGGGGGGGGEGVL